MSTGIYDITGYHNRRSIRLRGYDYSRAGMYFITICMHDRAQFDFGNIVGATGASPEIPGASPEMELNEYGHIIRDEWKRSFNIRTELIMDEYFKSGTIKRINELRKTPGAWVWQCNYFDHIVRNERSLFRIRQYIRNNPIQWFNDPKNHLKNEIDEFDENDNSW